MFDDYVVFYSSFVDVKRSQIKKKSESIFEKNNKASQESIEEMVKALSKKNVHSRWQDTENEDCRCSAV